MRRVMAGLSIVAAVGMTGLAPMPKAGGAPSTRPTSRPNVLLLLMDDARTGEMFDMQRSLAWIQGDGRIYPNAMVSTPSCGPSRGSILSGRYAHNHQVTQQGAVIRFDQSRSVQNELRNAGYHTAAVGKLINDWNILDRPPHFENWALTGGGYDNAKFVVDGMQTTAHYSTSFIGSQVNQYIDRFARDDGNPWFIYAGFTAPHLPEIPEPQYAKLKYPWPGNPATHEVDRTDKPAYIRHFNHTQQEGAAERQAQLRTLRSVDDAIESIREKLVADGELRNTLVILTSDNGKLFGEHGLPEKFMPYLQAEQVPLLISWPEHITPGVDDRLAANIDITPTILAAAGLRTSYQLDGRDLLSSNKRSALLAEYWKDPANGAGIPTWASTYVPNQYRYTEIYDDKGAVIDREYYNLARDPWQLTNLFRDGDAHDDPAIAPLAARLAQERRCVGMTCP